MSPYLGVSLAILVGLWVAYSVAVTLALMACGEESKKQKATIKELGEELGRWRRDYNIMKDGRDTAASYLAEADAKLYRLSALKSQIENALREYHNHGVQG